MANQTKILGQAKPGAGILANCYVVPSSTKTTVSTITVCNQSNTDDFFRVSVCKAGEADNPYQYIYHDVAITDSDTFACTFGITLAATDVIRVYSLHGNCSFNIFGIEVT